MAEAENRPISGANWPNFWVFRSSDEILDSADNLNIETSVLLRFKIELLSSYRRLIH